MWTYISFIILFQGCLGFLHEPLNEISFDEPLRAAFKTIVTQEPCRKLLLWFASFDYQRAEARAECRRAFDIYNSMPDVQKRQICLNASQPDCRPVESSSTALLYSCSFLCEIPVVNIRTGVRYGDIRQQNQAVHITKSITRIMEDLEQFQRVGRILI